MSKELIQAYHLHQIAIEQKIQEFKNSSQEQYFQEFLFCLLTPQSNAQRCWEAVQHLQALKKKTPSSIKNILRTRTRFHNNKSRYIQQAHKTWSQIQPLLATTDRKSLRNYLAEHVLGMGYKEAGHFLRNIGKSDNQIAILDRHILRNLKDLKIINTDSIKNTKHYLEIEKKFISFSKGIGIPIDHLDLLFWSKETGEIFK